MNDFNYDLDRMQECLKYRYIRMPSNMSFESFKDWINNLTKKELDEQLTQNFTCEDDIK